MRSIRHRRALVVEDNDLLLEMLTALCETNGIAVSSVSSGEAAVAAIRQAGTVGDDAFALLLTDINLPGYIDGWSVAQAFRTLHPGRPVICASTGGGDDRRAVPGSVFLTKPFRIRDVVDPAASMMGETAAEPEPPILPPRAESGEAVRP